MRCVIYDMHLTVWNSMEFSYVGNSVLLKINVFPMKVVMEI